MRRQPRWCWACSPGSPTKLSSIVWMRNSTGNCGLILIWSRRNSTWTPPARFVGSSKALMAMKALPACPRGSRSGRKTNNCCFGTGPCGRRTSRIRCPRRWNHPCASKPSNWRKRCTSASWSGPRASTSAELWCASCVMSPTCAGRSVKLSKCSCSPRHWRCCWPRWSDISLPGVLCCPSRRWRDRRDKLLRSHWGNVCPCAIRMMNSASWQPSSIRPCNASTIPSPNSSASLPTPRTNCARR
ncbi:hypothetical protein SDC9_121258 [bioreactor metagenome]|uniref:Uncharacterized protein n=1 Tax=bioreactor metagenome TaxID=1076179 RepID=A0A645CBG9_9ZZZZ